MSYAAGTLNVSQANAASGVKPCVFKVTLRGGNGESMTVDVDTFRDGPDQSIPVTPAFAVTQTFVDLGKRLPRAARARDVGTRAAREPVGRPVTGSRHL